MRLEQSIYGINVSIGIPHKILQNMNGTRCYCGTSHGVVGYPRDVQLRGPSDVPPVNPSLIVGNYLDITVFIVVY